MSKNGTEVIKPSTQLEGPNFSTRVGVFEKPRGCNLFASEASVFERFWLKVVRNYSTAWRKREAELNFSSLKLRFES